MAETKQDLLRTVRKAIAACEARLNALKEQERTADARYSTFRTDADGLKADRALTKRMQLQSYVAQLRSDAQLLESDIAEGKLGIHEGRVRGKAETSPEKADGLVAQSVGCLFLVGVLFLIAKNC